MQFSYVSMGANNARKLGSQFMNGVSYMMVKAPQQYLQWPASGAANSVSKSLPVVRTTPQVHTKTATSKAMNTGTTPRQKRAPRVPDRSPESHPA